MMDYQQLSMSVINYFGLDYQDHGEYLTMRTICHDGDSNKLYFYKDSARFYCFTHCHNLNVYELFARVEKISVERAKTTLNSMFKVAGGFEKKRIETPGNKFKRKEKSEDVELKPLSETVLNTYYKLPNSNWYEEGISKDVQSKFGIRYSIEENAIIIPHYLYNGDLVGVRKRNLNHDEVESGKKYIPVFQNGKFLKYPVHENLYGLYQNKDNINQSHKIVLFEAEKSVMMFDSFYGGNSYGAALSGSYLSDNQLSIISHMKIDEVIVGLDKEYSVGDSSEDMRRRMLEKQFNKLTTRFSVSVLWDRNGILNEKDSPTDKGKDVFEKLMRERLFL